MSKKYIIQYLNSRQTWEEYTGTRYGTVELAENKINKYKQHSMNVITQFRIVSVEILVEVVKTLEKNPVYIVEAFNYEGTKEWDWIGIRYDTAEQARAFIENTKAQYWCKDYDFRIVERRII